MNKELIGDIVGWIIGAWVLVIIVAMFWIDHQSARRHKRWMDNFTRRTNAKFGEGWEDEFERRENR